MLLQSQINALCSITHELLNLGFDGSPLYSDRFCKLNAAVHRQSEELYTRRSSGVEEEAWLCYALLSGFHATIHDNGNKNTKIQLLLDRSWKVLHQLPASLLKCQLLVACYAETFDDELAEEAHGIINTWEGHDLTLAEREVFDYLESLEANPYPSWEVIE